MTLYLKLSHVRSPVHLSGTPSPQVGRRSCITHSQWKKGGERKKKEEKEQAEVKEGEILEKVN